MEDTFITQMLTTDWKHAREKRGHLTDVMLHTAGFGSMEEFLAEVGPRTTVVTIVGGAASRWDKSFDEPDGAAIAKEYGIKRGKSRFLATVPNIFPDRMDDRLIPILTYNLFGVKKLLVGQSGQPLANHVLIYSKDEEVDAIKTITDKAGISQTIFCKQEVRPGKLKPSGHADALLQHLDVMTSSEFVLTHFGCDVTNPETIALSLLCHYTLHKMGEAIDVVLPTADMNVPKYPVFVDPAGIPRQFGHEKLLGKDSLHADSVVLSPGGSNIGLRIYRGEALRNALLALQELYSTREEFALDNVDQYFASLGTIRQFCIGLPEEISHAAKTLTEIPGFLANEKKILESL